MKLSPKLPLLGGLLALSAANVMAASSIVATGSNTSGQATAPTVYTDVVSVTAGSDHSVAVLADGTAIAWGYWGDQRTAVPTITDIVTYPAECVNPPAGVNSVEWIEGGMQGAKC